MLLYIDPGTGSMLFTILLGVVTTMYFFVRRLVVYIKFRISGGKVEKSGSEKIPYVIFSDGKQYWNVFAPICNEFERRRIPLEYWTASPDDPGLSCTYQYVSCKFIGEGNRAFTRLNMMNAAICLATTPGLDVLQWKRSRDVDWYVHILHAAGTSAAGYRMFSLDYYDAVLLTGSFQIDEVRELEQKRNLPAKELLVVGCTYMDELKKRLDQEGRDSHSGLTVLLAPSWGKSSILVRFGEEILDALIGTGFNLIIRPHPQSFTADREVMDGLMRKYPNSNQLSWNRDADNFQALNKADIMISDFSSVIFDYSLVFNKPFIYTENTFDNSVYDAAWLDEEMWKFRVLPSIGIPLRKEDFPRIKETIENAVNDKDLLKGREHARAEAWANIGESAKLTVDYLNNKYKELQDKT